MKTEKTLRAIIKADKSVIACQTRTELYFRITHLRFSPSTARKTFAGFVCAIRREKLRNQESTPCDERQRRSFPHSHSSHPLGWNIKNFFFHHFHIHRGSIFSSQRKSSNEKCWMRKWSEFTQFLISAIARLFSFVPIESDTVRKMGERRKTRYDSKNNES